MTFLALPLEIIILGDGEIVNEPERLTEDEEWLAAIEIRNQAKLSRVRAWLEWYFSGDIDITELNTGINSAIAERIADTDLTLEQLAAKYPQETADVIAKIMLNRANWRPFLPESRVYINGTNNFYLHRDDNGL